MAIQMTRAEYEAKYGVPPPVPQKPLAATSTPIKMTRAEYNAKYGVPPPAKNNPLGNLAERRPFFPADVETKNPLGNVARVFGNIPSSAINMGRLLVADPLANIAESGKIALDIYKERGVLKGTKDILGGFADTAKSSGNLYKKTGEAIYGALDKGYNALLDDPKKALGTATEYVAKVGIEDPLLIPSVIYGGSALGKKDIISRIASPITREVDTSIPAIVQKTRKAYDEASAVAAKAREKEILRDLEDSVTKTADEVYSVEQGYVGGRKANKYSKDGGQDSRTRIARSGVLSGSVNSDGLIITRNPGGATDRYKAQTIKGRESLGREILDREGATVNLQEVRRNLLTEVNKSGLEGADLIAAIRGVDNEIAGLAMRADEFGNVPLFRVHDAKINTTANINFQTPPEVSKFRKAIARSYKATIEQKSKTNIGEINEELSKYYEDIERLESLDGKRVKGGKLGRYAAQVAGNIGGGLVGGALGGAPGAAIASIAGGEIASALKGASMRGSLGAVRKGEVPTSKVLEKAKIEASLPKVLDLKTPDPVVGVSKGVEKTKEIVKIEGQIRNNVSQQRVAIKAGNFELVAKLKEVYVVLVEKLKEIVKSLSEKSPPMRGFIRIGRESKDVTKSQSKSLKVSPLGTSSTKPGVYQGETDLSTKLLEKLKGRTTVSRQFIEDLSNSPDLKQAERDLIRRVLGERNPTVARNGEKSVKLSSLPANEKEDLGSLLDDSVFDGTATIPNKGLVDVLGKADIKIFTADPKELKSLFGKSRYTSPATVQKYAQDMTSGANFPPVYIANGRFVDGGHRVEAAIQAGKDVRVADITNLLNEARSLGLGEEYKTVKDISKIGDDASDQISVPDFANKVKSELLPLKTTEPRNISEYRGAGGRYENITLPDELRGPVANYQERVYESPIKTSAGDVHFSAARGGTPENYFAHTRIEDLPGEYKGEAFGQKGLPTNAAEARGEGGTTRRVIEIQSDLFQKGRLEGETASTIKAGLHDPAALEMIRKELNPEQFDDYVNNRAYLSSAAKSTILDKIRPGLSEKVKKYVAALEKAEFDTRSKEVAKLEPYRNTWHERVIREEVKQAAKDGKTKLQFPTGETAVKIEGLGERNNWNLVVTEGAGTRNARIADRKLSPEDLKVGTEVADNAQHWIITDVLGDGKFKAVPKSQVDELKGRASTMRGQTDLNYKKLYDELVQGPSAETFDISGKVDTNNPIYKFYEKTVQKYLTNKYGGKVITDPQGVKWVEIDIKPEMKKLPIEAFGALGAVGLGATQQ